MGKPISLEIASCPVREESLRTNFVIRQWNVQHLRLCQWMRMHSHKLFLWPFSLLFLFTWWEMGGMERFPSVSERASGRRARFFWRRSLVRPLALWPLSSFASRLLSFLLRIIASTRVAGCSPRRAWLKILMMWCVSPHLYFHKADQSGNIAAVAFWSTDTQTFNEYDKAEQKSI